MIIVRGCSQTQFRKLLADNNVICFCAGKKFIEFCNNYNSANNILYVVDNFKSEDAIRIDNYTIPIKRIDDIGDEIRSSVIVITSTINVLDIVEQLDKIDLFDGIEVYILDFILSTQSSSIIENNKPAIIPKKIHYCWFGKAEMPKQFQDNIDTWKRHCPDYEIIRWDETNYDVTKNKYMLQAYKARKWGFVPDYARLDIIYENGGIYLDTDVEVLKSFDKLLSYKMFCGFESTQYVALGLGFGAVKHHKIIFDMMRAYDSIDFLSKNNEMNLTASPVYQTNILQKFGLIRNGLTQETDNYIALSPEYLSPINGLGIGKITSESFSIHQYAATWFDQQRMNELKNLRKYVQYINSRIVF